MSDKILILKEKIMDDLKQHQMYVQVVLEGCSIEFGPLSLIDLTTCVGTHIRGYQIHCDAYRVKHDLVYDDVDEAVKEFLQLKKRLSK